MLPRADGAGLAGGTQEEGLGDGGGGGSPAVLPSVSATNGKGPKSFFRLRVLPCRKLVALLAVGLCVLAGERAFLYQEVNTSRQPARVLETNNIIGM